MYALMEDYVIRHFGFDFPRPRNVGRRLCVNYNSKLYIKTAINVVLVTVLVVIFRIYASYVY